MGVGFGGCGRAGGVSGVLGFRSSVVRKKRIRRITAGIQNKAAAMFNGRRSGELGFELGPTGVEGVDSFLGLFQLEAGGVEFGRVAGNLRVVEGGEFALEFGFGVVDGFFHKFQLAGFFVGEFLACELLRRAGNGFGGSCI